MTQDPDLIPKDPPEKLFSCSTLDLYGLLYGFDEYFGRRPRSVSRHETPEFKVRVVPYTIGVLIKNADEEESLFHVELHATDNTADIWHAATWRTSISRKLRTVGDYCNLPTTDRERLHADLRGRLLKHFSSTYYNFKHALALTELFLAGPMRPEYLQLAALPAELADMLSKYRNGQEDENS